MLNKDFKERGLRQYIEDVRVEDFTEYLTIEAYGKHIYTIPVKSESDFKKALAVTIVELKKEVSSVFIKRMKVTVAPTIILEEWHNDRLGNFSSTSVPLDSKCNPSYDKKNQINKVAVDAVVKNLSHDHPVRIEHEMVSELNSIKKMDRGSALEEKAISLYEEEHGLVSRVGFAKIDGFNIGDSIDGLLVIENGGIETKCPSLYSYMDDDYVDSYTVQINMHMFVHGLDFVDFVVYFPHLPLKVTRVQRDEELMANMASSVIEFQEAINHKTDMISRQIS